MPQVFGVPTVTDGIGMGTEGMKYSLVSREVIADAIETSVNGQCMDGVLVVGGCDKNMPARHDGDRAHERARDLRLRRHDQAGQWKGQALTIVSPFEAVGALPPARWRRRTTTASSATPARRSARAAACTRRTRCRRRSRRSA